MSVVALTCPHCGSPTTKYNAVKAYWRCQNDACEETFEGAPLIEQQVGKAPTFKPQKIFISYGHDQNVDLVKELKARLERAGHKIWIDYEQIDVAKDWHLQITKGIQESDRVLFFISKNNSQEIGVGMYELLTTLANRPKALLPLLVENVLGPEWLWKLQWLDLVDWQKIREQGDADWQAWLDEQSIRILEIISPETALVSE